MRAQLLTIDHLVQLMDPQLYLHLQSADSTNFFFFFRMLLVWYKREFEWSDVLRLWETLWSDYLTSNFHLFIALAILEKHRDVIMDHLKHFDEVLKYSMSHSPLLHLSVLISTVNELSNTMDILPILARAESLFHRFARSVEAIDKKNNFPAPSSHVQHRKPAQSQSQPQSEPSNNKGKSPEQPSPAPAPGSNANTPSGTSTALASSSKQGAGAGIGSKADTRVISPELRDLLRKDVYWYNQESFSDGGADRAAQSRTA